MSFKTDPSPTDTAPAAAADGPPRRAERVHLDFLDGLRGLAAFYVFLYHVVHRDSVAWTGFLQYGREAVAIFIVLSGYCLMMPVVQDPAGRLRGGVWGFFRRRARRILPPYYPALFLWPAYLLAVRGLKYVISGESDFGFLDTMFGDGSLAAHLLLYLNVRPDWIGAIAPAMWSVALEWQIYFVFALLLVPLYRRAGMAVSLLTATALGLAPVFLLPAGRDFAWTCPWFLGLFALGMAGAVVNFGKGAPAAWGRDRLPWGVFAPPLFAGFLGLKLLPLGAWQRDIPWLTDFLLGGATVCLMIYCTRAAYDTSRRARPVVVRALESRIPVGLGKMSYSLYLTHLPLFAILGTTLNFAQLSLLGNVWLSLFIGAPLLLLGAYGFYLLIEKPFSVTPPRPRPVAQDAASAAPPQPDPVKV